MKVKVKCFCEFLIILKITPIFECKYLKCCSKLFCFISLFYSPAVTFWEGGRT